MARPTRLAAWRRAQVAAWRPGLTHKELLDSTPGKRARQPGWGLGQAGRECTWTDGGRSSRGEAQGHSEDAGLLSGLPAPRGSAQPPYLFQITKQSVWTVRCCREVGSRLGSLVSRPTSLPSGHEAHLP